MNNKIKNAWHRIQRGRRAYELGLKLAQRILDATDARQARWVVRNSNRLYWISRGYKPVSTCLQVF